MRERLDKMAVGEDRRKVSQEGACEGDGEGRLGRRRDSESEGFAFGAGDGGPRVKTYVPGVRGRTVFRLTCSSICFCERQIPPFTINLLWSITAA